MIETFRLRRSKAHKKKGVRWFVQLSELVRIGDRNLRRQAILLVILSVVGAFAELLTVGSVVPLLVAAADPSRLSRLPVLGPQFGEWLGSFHGGPVVAAAVILTSSAILAAAIRLWALWTSQNLVYRFHSRLVVAMYNGVLFQEYPWFVANNGSDFVSAIEKIFLTAINLFVSVVLAIPALFMSLVILFLLFAIDFGMALGIVGILGLLYVTLAYLALAAVDEISRSAANTRNRRIRFAHETWGAARDIIIDHSQAAYVAKAMRLESQFADIHVRSAMIGLAPRVIVDASIVILISGVVVLLAGTPEELLISLPALGAFALGGQRLIPMAQQIYLTYANQKIYAGYIDDALTYVRLPTPEPATSRSDGGLTFLSTVQLQNVSFIYPNNFVALRSINLTIEKGAKIGVVGKTGSGKSTLADIIMGLLLPSEGTIAIDGIPLTRANVYDWRAKIAHVPQSIFLVDDTLLANVVLGEHAVDIERAKQACTRAGLSDFFREHAEGMMRRVGERGIQLSGGQRQRIGIARALYKGAEILVLDEATSALDEETEAAILNLVFEMHDVTVLMVSHRHSFLSRCDRVVLLNDGCVVES